MTELGGRRKNEFQKMGGRRDTGLVYWLMLQDKGFG